MKAKLPQISLSSESKGLKADRCARSVAVLLACEDWLLKAMMARGIPRSEKENAWNHLKIHSGSRAGQFLWPVNEQWCPGSRRQQRVPLPQESSEEAETVTQAPSRWTAREWEEWSLQREAEWRVWSSQTWREWSWQPAEKKVKDTSDPPSWAGWEHYRVWKRSVERWNRNTDLPLERRAGRVLSRLEWPLQARLGVSADPGVVPRAHLPHS